MGPGAEPIRPRAGWLRDADAEGSSAVNAQPCRTLRRWVNAMVRRPVRRRRDTWQHPLGPPIEQLAAELRRLLWQHDVLVRSAPEGGWDRRRWSLEIGIAYRAGQAAQALDVPLPVRRAGPGMERTQLTGLLRALVAEGLVLPGTVTLLVPENRH